MKELEQMDFDFGSMDMEEYQATAMQTAIYPDALIYPMLGLQGEVGELSEKLKKFFRDNDTKSRWKTVWKRCQLSFATKWP